MGGGRGAGLGRCDTDFWAIFRQSSYILSHPKLNTGCASCRCPPSGTLWCCRFRRLRVRFGWHRSRWCGPRLLPWCNLVADPWNERPARFFCHHDARHHYARCCMRRIHPRTVRWYMRWRRTRVCRRLEPHSCMQQLCGLPRQLHWGSIHSPRSFVPRGLLLRRARHRVLLCIRYLRM